MSDRKSQRELDLLAIRFVEALEARDFDTIDQLWENAAMNPELEEILIETMAELVRDYDQESQAKAKEVVREILNQQMPTVEVIRPSDEPMSVAEVADALRRTGVPGLSGADFAVNDALARVTEPLPTDLGLTALIAWGEKFGKAPVGYWKAFRQTALKLRLRRESESNYQLAARPQRPRDKK